MRTDFLTRFTAVLVVVAIGVGVTLSVVFSQAHLRSLERDLIANSIGQASAALAPILNGVDPNRPINAVTQRRLESAIQQLVNFQEFTHRVRLYHPNGTGLFTGMPPGVNATAVKSVVAQNVIQSAPFRSGGEDEITAYVPLASSSGAYVAVAAVDLSLSQLRGQDARERNFVFITTLAGSALIFISLLALAIAAQRELNRRGRLANETFLSTMTGIATVVDRRDPYTAGHSARVARYSVLLAQSLKLSSTIVERIESAALLHDLGKIGIPDAVLLKPASLDPNERRIIEMHPTIAKEMLGGVEAMSLVVGCIAEHHERIDGRGYPDGLVGEKIRFEARIIAVADAFDAMTTDRPYRRALGVAEARRRLAEGSGTQWDARCVAGFDALVESGAIVPPPSIENDIERSSQFGRRYDVT